MQDKHSNKDFTAEDIVSVSFNILGDGNNLEDYSIDVNNLMFNYGTVDIAEEKNEKMKILDVYPNPSTSNFTFTYELESNSNVNLSIYDVSGKLVKTIVDGYYPSGKRMTIFNTQEISAGVYYAKLLLDDKNVSSSRIVLIK